MRDAAKYRLDTIKRIRASHIDLNKVSCFLNTHEDHLIRRTYFKKLLGTLVENDVYISVMHELMLDNEWESISIEYNTPIEKSPQKKLREKIESFADAFIALCDNVREEDFEDILKYVDKYVLLTKSRNMKYILLTILEVNQEETLMHFIRKIRSSFCANLNHYLIYFVSLLVRCRIKERYRKIAVEFFLEFFRKLEASKSLGYIVPAQLLLYLCCFRKEVELEARDLLQNIFSLGYARYMNRMVVETFCKELSYVLPKNFENVDSDILFLFPLDPPIISRIRTRFEDFYIIWDSKKSLEEN